MFQKSGYFNKSKLLWFVLVFWVFVACHPLATAIKETPIPEMATKTLTAAPSPTLLPDTPAFQKTLAITPTPSPTLVLQNTPTSAIHAWENDAQQYGLIAIADRGEANQLWLFSPSSQSEEILPFTNGVAPLSVEQVLDNCDLVVLRGLDESGLITLLGKKSVIS